ncbi:MAG: CotH kinase family protein [Opitutales bacterium]|nr:CotH kinase family protein [Opitutales bacterium]
MKQAPRPFSGTTTVLVCAILFAHVALLRGGDVVINEIMASNGATIADEDGDFPDWVELYNRGATPVELTGWGFSDRVDNPFKWIIGEAVIPAQGRLLIWASGKDRPGPEHLHAGFSISADGEPVVLTRPDGSTADMVPAVPIPRDISYGRITDGGLEFGYFEAPTPMAANADTAAAFLLAPPEFSHRRGFYDEPFDLELRHEDPQATIVYSLDGSKPTLASGIPYTGPVPVDASAVVRAAAFREDALSAGNVVTATYLFLDDVIQRTREAPEGYPNTWTWGNFDHISYGMSEVVIAREGYPERMKEALLDIPTVSLVIPVDDMFGSNGIYANPTQRVEGVDYRWERETSVEWIDPNGGPEFNVNAGLRIQGAGSRGDDSTPKKSFRLLFKSDYGPSELDFPAMAPQGSPVQSYNTIILKAKYNNSWTHWWQRYNGLYLLDQWMKDRQAEMSGIGSHGRHVHLYINGLYWGLYMLSERPDAAWAAGYLGGEREEYDARSWREGMRDGDEERWNADIQGVVQSDLSDNANYLALQEVLDIDHFIDYNLTQMFAGNTDWPRNNWTAVRHREDGPVLHVVWDTESAFEDVNENVVHTAWDPPRRIGDPPTFFGPLRHNAEFRLRFADRVRLHMFNGGALTPEATVPDLARVAAEARPAVFAEEARWGSYRIEIRERRTPVHRYGVESHWDPTLDRMLNEYLPQRTEIVVGQLRDAGFYPDVDAPDFAQHGGGFTPGFNLTIENPNGSGTVYYTTDGSDPREFGTGAVAAGGHTYSGGVTLTGAVVVKARILDNGTWSAVTEASFFPNLDGFVFLPGGSADWTDGENWDGGHFPNGSGTDAEIAAPSPDADRNVNIRGPVTVGSISFQQGESAGRNRVRDRDAGNTLTFSDPGGSALIEVSGDGPGFVEFDVDAGTFLASDLVLNVLNPEGDPDHGALRLRRGWSGPGGLTKTGAGFASLTGSGKSFSGAVTITEGALMVTEPATPRSAKSVAVGSGGQLRLISGSGGGDTRIYTFGGRVSLDGPGLESSGLPEGEGMGLLGALRYDPGVNDNHAVLTDAVDFSGPASLHVDGTRNTLELTGKLSGNHGFSKSGGGTIVLTGSNAGYTAPVTVSHGSLLIRGTLGSGVTVDDTGVLGGTGRVGALSGSGGVVVDRGVLHAPSADGLYHSFVLSQSVGTVPTGAPPPGNGVLRLDAAPGNVGLISLYVTEPADETQALEYMGGLFVPASVDLEAILGTTHTRVYLPDEDGEHEFNDRSWTRATEAVVSVETVEWYFNSGYATGKTLRVEVPTLETDYTAWRDSQFPDPADRANPAVSGPFAVPRGDGVANLQRYAVDIGLDADPAPRMPVVRIDGGALGVDFFHLSSRTDLRYRVRASADLVDWSEILFDSAEDPLPASDGGWVSISDPAFSTGVPARFYHVEIRFRDGFAP